MARSDSEVRLDVAQRRDHHGCHCGPAAGNSRDESRWASRCQRRPGGCTGNLRRRTPAQRDSRLPASAVPAQTMAKCPRLRDFDRRTSTGFSGVAPAGLGPTLPPRKKTHAPGNARTARRFASAGEWMRLAVSQEQSWRAACRATRLRRARRACAALCTQPPLRRRAQPKRRARVRGAWVCV